MSFRVNIADSIHELDEERWDALAAAELAMSHRWQRVMESSRTDYRPRYVLAEDARGPVLAATTDTRERFGRSGWRERLLRRTALMVGAPYSSRHSGLAWRSDAPAGCIERVLAELAGRERRPLLGVSNVAAGDLPAWRARSFVPRQQPPSMVLDLRYSSYEAYLESLSAVQRKELRRAHRRAAETGVTLDLSPLEEIQADLYPLLAEVCARHGWMPFSTDLFSVLRREMPGEVLVFSGAVAGQLAGFFLCLRQGQTLLAILAGLRYALAYPSSLYFVLLDALIRWSLLHNVQRIHAGLTNEVQKQRHGFTAQPRWLCVRGYPDPLNILLRKGL